MVNSLKNGVFYVFSLKQTQRTSNFIALGFENKEEEENEEGN